MQLIVTFDERKVVQIICPGCKSLLETVKEQDRRVHIMRHPVAEWCKWSEKMLRVDRRTGYAEPWPSVTEEEVKVLCSPTEDETRTSTTTSGKTPCTTSRNVTQHTPRDTVAGVRGHIRRWREPGW